MKPLCLIWVGLSHEGHVTAGQTYTIVAKERNESAGIVWYQYQFIDDAGNKEWAASRLFLKAKPQMGQRKAS